MGQVFAPPTAVKKPEWEDYKDWQLHLKAEQQYEEEIITWVKQHYTGAHVGKVVHFPQGDGYAAYVIAGLKPVKLIHLDTGDAWHYPYIERLTAADIKAKLKQQAGLAKIFGKK
jgi:O-acetyl-ADP-ribose deacetylase (regulator of RNase III)